MPLPGVPQSVPSSYFDPVLPVFCYFPSRLYTGTVDNPELHLGPWGLLSSHLPFSLWSYEVDRPHGLGRSMSLSLSPSLPSSLDIPLT